MFHIIFTKSLIFFFSLTFGSTFCNNFNDAIIFRDSQYNRQHNEDNVSSDQSMSPTERELQISQELSQIESFEELLNRFSETTALSPGSISNRFGDVERANVHRIPQAGCTLQRELISLNSTARLFYPTCIRIPRCSGCCGSPHMSCQPVESVTKNVEVITMELDWDMNPKMKSREIVPVEEHTKCRCQCIVKAEHCNEKQTYRSNICGCICTNKDEETKCLKNNDTRLWNSNTCTCKCRQIYECSSGHYYDHSSCSCKKVTLGLKIPSYGTDKAEGFDQNSGYPLTIYTLDSSDPRRKPKEDPE